MQEEYIPELNEPATSVGFDLSIAPEFDTLTIFTSKNISFNFNTDGLGIHSVGFSIPGDSWSFEEGHGTFTVRPENLVAGYHDLTATIRTHSGTGSMADNMNAEHLVTQKKWRVLVDGRQGPEITPTKSITPEGYLKFTWPKCDQYNFSAYGLVGRIGDKVLAEMIEDPDVTYYIDSNYVTGIIDFEVQCHTVTYAFPTLGDSYDEIQYASQMYIEELGMDSLRISWDKSDYNAKYKLSWESTEMIFDSREDTVVVIPRTFFAKGIEYKLITASANSEDWPLEENEYTAVSSSNMLGSRISYDEAEYAYNFIDKIVYTNDGRNVKFYDPATGTIDIKGTIYNIIFGGMFSCPTNSTELSIFVHDDLFVLEGFNSANYETFEIPGSWAYSMEHFLMTDADIIAFTTGEKYKLLDISKQQTIDSITIDDYPTENEYACFATSQDAKRTCVVTQNGLKLFNIEATGIIEYYTDSRSYRSAYFDPFNPDKLFLTLNDHSNIEIRNPSDFSLIGTIALPSNAVIQNIDPESGYLLLTDYNELFIVDVLNGEIVFRINCIDPKPKLYANTLFSQNGFYLDITEKLQ